MSEKQISYELRMRVRKYLEYIYKEEKIMKSSEEAELLSKLSETLKDQLLIEANGALIRDIKFLSLNFSSETLSKTVPLLKEVHFTPGDIIFEENDVPSELYIIRKGEIELFVAGQSGEVKGLKKISKGGVIGEVGFFTELPRGINARCVDFSTVICLDRNKFIDLIRKSPKDFEKFCSIKDQLILYDDYGDLYNKCNGCLSKNHRLSHCPLLHYIPPKQVFKNIYYFFYY